jgi:hypothetical protein
MKEIFKALFKIIRFKEYGVGDKLPKGVKFGELMSRNEYISRQCIKIINAIYSDTIEITKINLKDD